MTIDWDAMNKAIANDFKLDFTCHDCKKVLNSKYLKFVGNGKGKFRVGYYMDGLVKSVLEQPEGGDLFCLCGDCTGKSECEEAMW